MLVVVVVEHQQNRSFVLLLSLRTEGFSSYNDDDGSLMNIWLDCNKEVSPHSRVSKLTELRWTQLTTGPAVSEMPWTVITDRTKSLNDPTHGSRYYIITPGGRATICVF